MGLTMGGRKGYRESWPTGSVLPASGRRGRFSINSSSCTAALPVSRQTGTGGRRGLPAHRHTHHRVAYTSAASRRAPGRSATSANTTRPSAGLVPCSPCSARLRTRSCKNGATPLPKSHSLLVPSQRRVDAYHIIESLGGVSISRTTDAAGATEKECTPLVHQTPARTEAGASSKHSHEHQPSSGRRSKEMGLTMGGRKGYRESWPTGSVPASGRRGRFSINSSSCTAAPATARVVAADVGQDRVRAPRRQVGQGRGRPALPVAPQPPPLRPVGRGGAHESVVPVRLLMR